VNRLQTAQKYHSNTPLFKMLHSFLQSSKLILAKFDAQPRIKLELRV